MMSPIENLLNAKDRIIEQQEEQIELLKSTAELRRLAHMYQSAELADLRRYHHVNNNRWGFLIFMLVGDVWPFKHVWK